MTNEVRFYLERPTNGVDFLVAKSRFRLSRSDVIESVECSGPSRERACRRARGPVVFCTPVVRLLQPFMDTRYDDLDGLARDLHASGIPLTDMRRAVGVITDVERLLEMLKTNTIENFKGEVILIDRHPNGTHEDIWQIREGAFRWLRWTKMIRRKTPYHVLRQVFGLGDRPLDDLPDIQRDIIRSELNPLKPKVPPSSVPLGRGFVTITPSQPTLPTFPPLPAPLDQSSVPAAERSQPRMPFRKPPGEPKRSHAPVPNCPLAYDDDGGSITELDVTRERNRLVPRNMPANLIPDAPEGCSDKEWEKLMLVEQIKFRRRAAKE